MPHWCCCLQDAAKTAAEKMGAAADAVTSQQFCHTDHCMHTPSRHVHAALLLLLLLAGCWRRHKMGAAAATDGMNDHAWHTNHTDHACSCRTAAACRTLPRQQQRRWVPLLML
jgi:hypothetical protein